VGLGLGLAGWLSIVDSSDNERTNGGIPNV
jgi:hypothetical protein